ncbi:MAG: glycosyltransferase family 2 protein [Clostridia bacterium]|nr:glycosyltransferase family 2 protein [Clostridia bacterium]
MSENKLISIVIPVYNEEENIRRSLESINNDSVEIIVVNDGSTDNTLEICREYEAKNSNIKVFTQENQGQNAARYNAISHASGEYIMFLDSDDSYNENTVARVMEAIEKYNHPDLIRFRYQILPERKLQDAYFEEQEKYIEKKDFKELVYPMFLNSYRLNALGMDCVKKSVVSNIGNEGSEVRFGEDLLANLRMFSEINNVLFLKDVLYNYIFNEKSTTKSNNKYKLASNMEDMVTIYTRMYHYLLKWNMCNDENMKYIEDRIKRETDVILTRLELK